MCLVLDDTTSTLDMGVSQMFVPIGKEFLVMENQYTLEEAAGKSLIG